jgi:ATP-dependent Lhr-like helicase
LSAATTLLERYGVVSREAVLAEEIPGGFSSLYPVLEEMEETGRVRRGYFVDGLAGGQFALPGAVERLRDARRDEEASPRIEVLPAVDPANPWGALLPWPEGSRADGPRPRRVAGAWVILAGGTPVVFLDAGGRSLVTFPALDEEVDAQGVAGAMVGIPRRSRRRTLVIERIDGEPAGDSPRAAWLERAGFVREYRGLRHSG